MKKILCNNENPNGILVDMTAEEISQKQSHVANLEAERQAKAEAEAQAQAQKEAEENAKETAQASGNQKLLDLGLTQAEATALTGYTPPVAE